MKRPKADEYDTFYSTYVDKVPDGDIVSILEENNATTEALLASLDDQEADYRYEPGKWSIKEVVGHMVDTERIFGFRALAIARGDRQPIPGMDQDAYAEQARFSERSLGSILEEFRYLRRSHTVLFRSFGEDIASRRGTASGVEFTVRAIAYIMAGHEIHHTRVLRERYLGESQ